MGPELRRGTQASAVIFLKSLTVLFLNLSFVSEVSGGCQVLMPWEAQAGCGEGEAYTPHTDVQSRGTYEGLHSPPQVQGPRETNIKKFLTMTGRQKDRGRMENTFSTAF